MRDLVHAQQDNNRTYVSHLSGGATETSAQPAGFGTLRRSVSLDDEARWLPGVHRAGPSPPRDELSISSLPASG
jgi:hypothetical protein